MHLLIGRQFLKICPSHSPKRSTYCSGNSWTFISTHLPILWHTWKYCLRQGSSIHITYMEIILQTSGCHNQSPLAIIPNRMVKQNVKYRKSATSYVPSAITTSPPGASSFHGPLTPFQCILGYQPTMFPWSKEPSEVPSVNHSFQVSERVWDSAHHHLTGSHQIT